MSIASVITLGYGKGVKFLPTLGYLSGSAPVTEQITGRGYTYAPSHLKHGAQEQKVQQAKSDLDRIESVLKETERLKLLASESRIAAQKRNALKRAIELEAKETEYLTEINRLLMVRAELMRILRIEEEILVMMFMARKRFRRFAQPASKNSLH